MAKRKISEIIDPIEHPLGYDTAWNQPKPDGSYAAYDGDAIEQWLRANQLVHKYGCIVRTADKDEHGYYHLHCFADEARKTEYYAAPEEHPEYLLADIDIPISDEEGTTYQFKLETTTPRDGLTSLDGTLKLNIKFSSTMKTAGQEAVEEIVDGTLIVQGRTGQTAWTQLTTMPITSNNSVYREISVAEYMPANISNYQLRLIVTVDYEGITGQTNALNYNNVTKTKMSLEFANNWQIPVHTSQVENGLELRYYIGGVVDKNLYIRVYGKNSSGVDTYRDYVVTPPNQTYVETPYTTTLVNDNPAQCNILSHGIHRIEAYLKHTATTIQSPTLTNSVMVVADEQSQTPYLIVQDINRSVQNYVSANLLKFAVYKPSLTEAFPVKFAYSDYQGVTDYMTYELSDTENEQVYNIVNTIEIENSVDNTLYAYLTATSNGTDILTPAVGAARVEVVVDNTEKYTPVGGVDFYLNPKTRNNAQSNRDKIINARNGQELEGSVFTNFDWVTDGWLSDSNGIKCLHIPAGRSVTIPYNLFSGLVAHPDTGNMTVEFDFATRYVSDEDTPIIKASSVVGEIIKGIEMKPLEGAVYSATNQNYLQQNFAWSEGVRTHIAINIVKGIRSAESSTTIDLIRVFVNGGIEREMLVTRDANEFSNVANIIIGQDDSDIDIYSIRCYQKALASDEVNQDYISSLPTAADKVSEKKRNDITQDGVITYESAKAKYNTLLWHGVNVSMYQQTDQKGDLELSFLNEDGTQDRKHSGMLTNLTMKGQGTTAKTYWEWNQQWQWKDATGSFVNLDDEDMGQKYALTDDVPAAKKLVNKINYASPMQSHKIGATALYNDLYKRLCITDNLWFDDEKLRVCVSEKPVLCFLQETPDTIPHFIGLGTFGSGKMDKPTWGYEGTRKSTYPYFAMLEGADNNVALCDMRAPWDDEVYYDPDKESYIRGGEVSLDFDAGATDEIEGKEYPKDTTIQFYKDAWNFLYEHSPFIEPYNGTLEQLQADQTIDKSNEYFVTSASQISSTIKGDMFRWNKTGESSGSWVRSQITKNGQKVNVNVFSTYNIPDSGDYNAVKQQVIDKRTAEFKTTVDGRNYLHKESIIFNHEFIKYIAGTDNRSKNTYYVNMPYNYGGQTKWLITLHADDLDTIMLTNNVGWQSKPYWCEEQDRAEDGSSYWEGQKNVLFRLIELAYPDECRSWMLAILKNMTEISKDSVEKCLEQYFYAVQRYFPNVAYNETARIRYENAQIAVQDGRFPSPVVQPITQSIGRYLQGEIEFMKRRTIYLSSYCDFGEFSGDNGFKIRGLSGAALIDTSFTLTPHYWLYPSGFNRTTPVTPHTRVKAGDTYILRLGDAGGDSEFGIHGINYFKSIGNLYKIQTSTTAKISVGGERLVELIAEPPTGETANFAPPSLQITAPLCKKVSVKGCAKIGEVLDLTALTRLQSVDVSGTKIYQVKAPATSSLVSMALSDYTTTISITNAPNLSQFAAFNASSVQDVVVNNAPLVNTYALLNRIYNAQKDLEQKPLQTLEFVNVNWSNVNHIPFVWAVPYFANATKLTGEIVMDSNSFTLNELITVTGKFGDVKQTGNPLHITYTVFNLTRFTISGPFYCQSAGDYQYTMSPYPSNANNINIVDGKPAIEWALQDGAELYASFTDKVNGVLHATGEQSAEGQKYQIFCTIQTSEGSKSQDNELKVGFYRRTPKVGDFAYFDGTFDDNWYNDITNKPCVGIVYAVIRKTNASSGAEYLDVNVCALNDVVITSSDGSYQNASPMWGLFNDNNNSNGFENTKYNVPSITGMESIFDIATLNNYGSSGFEQQGFLEQDKYLNSATADGFKVLTSGASSDWNGRQNCEFILQHLDKAAKVLPSAEGITLATPTTLLELGDEIKRLLDRVTSAKDRWMQWLYPAMYASYLYEPTLDNPSLRLADAYKKHNWYLPAQGQLTRLCYYYYAIGETNVSPSAPQIPETITTSTKDCEKAIFRNANIKVGYTLFIMNSNGRWASTENSANNAFGWNFEAGTEYKPGSYANNEQKSKKHNVRPVTSVTFNL